MTALSRRRFLAASAASAAASATSVGAPAIAAPIKGQVAIAIIGAGVAGIAAARRILSTTKASIAFIEASDRIGGRCFTDTSTFGVPFDRGAHWIRTPETNPVTPFAAKSGFDIYPSPPGQRVRIGRRYARAGEMEDYLTASVRAGRAIVQAGRGRDISCAQALPMDLGDWQQTIEFVLGPFGSARELSELSTADFARSTEREADAVCRQGLGALITKLAEGLPVQLTTAASRIDWSERNNIEIATARGRLSARTVIVTVSTGVLMSDKLRFDPELPRRHVDAIEKLRLGSYDHIALELPGNPLGLQRDEIVFEKSESARTAAILANISGSALCTIEVGGKFGGELAAAGEPAMISFALDWLAGLYGADIRKSVRRTSATRWNHQPWTLGAFSSAAPGGQWARATLAEPVRNRLFFAGEATHETMWGTVGGAWASGERAADAALIRLGFISEPPEPKRPAASRR